ncbi:MAG: NAD(P)H-binding protein [Luteitalea sp.]|nr:NAD(P)H-binding protein [Luteitalea sp.]
MATLALFGATGAIGRSMVDALRVDGTPYRVVGRSRSALEGAFGTDALAEIATWNPEDEASIKEAAAGIDTIVYAVGVPYWEFRLHPILMKKTIDAAIAVGVAHILLIGTVYPYGRPRAERVREDHPREPHTFKGKMRKEQEDLLLAADAAGRLRGAVLRLPDFYGPNVDKSLMGSAFRAAKEGGRAPLLGPIDTPHEFVFVPDVGPVVTKLVREPRAWGSVWHFGGLGVITIRAFAEEIFAQAGRQPKLFVVNNWMLRVAGVFNPMMRELVEMNYLLKTPVIMNDDRLRDLLPGVHKTAYSAGITATLGAM